MVWFKVSDRLHDHRMTRLAGAEAIGLWTLAGSWCADNPTDGFVPAAILSRWTPHWASSAAKLCDVGLWYPDQRAGKIGYEFAGLCAFSAPGRPSMPILLRRTILARDGARCGHCGTTEMPLVIDHVMPLALGGSFDDPTNLQVLCARCNSYKGAMHPDVWSDFTVNHVLLGTCGVCSR